MNKIKRTNLVIDNVNQNSIYPSMVIRSQAETIKLLEKELDQYKNNWEELKKWISTEARIELYGDGKGFRTFLDEKEVLNKMRELEEDK